MRDRDKERIGPDAAQPPDEHGRLKRQNVDAPEQHDLPPELVDRADGEERLQLRKLCLAEERRDGADIRQRARLLSFVPEELEQPLRSQLSFVRIRKHCRHHGFERSRVGDGVQVDGRGRLGVSGMVEEIRASRIRERNRQHRDAGGCGNREHRKADPIGPALLLSRASFVGDRVGDGHCGAACDASRNGRGVPGRTGPDNSPLLCSACSEAELRGPQAPLGVGVAEDVRIEIDCPPIRVRRSPEYSGSAARPLSVRAVRANVIARERYPSASCTVSRAPAVYPRRCACFNASAPRSTSSRP